MFCTKRGVVKKSRFENYARPRNNGLIAIKLNEGDEVIEVKITSGNDDIIIGNKNGRAIRFNENGVRVMGRNSTGVRGMKLDDEEDEAVGMLVMQCNEALSEEQWKLLDQQNSDDEEEVAAEEQVEDAVETAEVEGSAEVTVAEGDGFPEDILVVSEKGFGKRTPLGEYRLTKRGGKGIKTLNVTEKTGKLIAIKSVTDEDDLMIINKSGVAIRLAISTIREQGRNTQGVSLINIKKRNDVISSVCKVAHVEESEEDEITDEIIVDTEDNKIEDNDVINESENSETEISEGQE